MQDCLGLILDLLDPVTVAILEKVNRGLYSMIQVNTTNGETFWRLGKFV